MGVLLCCSKLNDELTIKLLNFRTLENSAIMNLKFKQRGQNIGFFVQKIQIWTNRLANPF